ncbi:hypothetical protein EDC01DRAFT_630536 [Geopyxis carbonaria]|nr:hypothetical protein EDC01DRAFT_630536 [Geopyxis carbonaria]
MPKCNPPIQRHPTSIRLPYTPYINVGLTTPRFNHSRNTPDPMPQQQTLATPNTHCWSSPNDHAAVLNLRQQRVNVIPQQSSGRDIRTLQQEMPRVHVAPPTLQKWQAVTAGAVQRWNGKKMALGSCGESRSALLPDFLGSEEVSAKGY